MNKRRSIAAALLAVGLALALTGCAASKLTRARQAVTAAATLGKSSADLFVAFDDLEQNKIRAQLKQDHDVAKAEAAREAWNAKQATATKALKTFNATVATAGALAELEAGNGTLDLPRLLGSLATAYGALKDALKQYGVQLPAGL